MKIFKCLLIFVFLISSITVNAQEQESNDYIEFNDRRNVVHGVYLGLTTHYGEIKGKDTYFAGLKIAYVANQQFEVGFVANGFYSQQNLIGEVSSNEDLVGGYAGLHLEPIFFSKSKVNLSFPLLIGSGITGFIDGYSIDDNDGEQDFNDNNGEVFFIVEPGVNMLFNISRYLQIEAGVKYRLSSRLNLNHTDVTRINGFSAGLGIKVGVFNMGRNRYKKHLNDGKK